MIKITCIASSRLKASDFDMRDFNIFINPAHVVSISDLLEFKKPISDEFVAYYGVIKTVNGDVYFVRKEEYKLLLDYFRDKRVEA